MPTPYILFCSDMRSKVKSDNPGMSFGDVARTLGKLWKELPEEKKKEYKEKSDADKEAHKNDPKPEKKSKRSPKKDKPKSSEEDENQEE
ncbi:HMG box family protein [Trichomonas vaginalis G3]|uniref:HMG box family protein n=1 Tax=Trichomonas vaginalis (strain ATCC PRA-98 / G3) TaxID=412133 RepID=A2GAT4_TRIV3|nr:DNA binding [Trichomonas vaginalis G3]EAX85735.1 HMG box family protein [Trichomonas vaginalis G3]KAI5535390.1 DNA binding [Trichomonas vaginalis G3]|eukprot:XP_001298665.1 HMG box family protein [Trichomonas vaginalis G3]